MRVLTIPTIRINAFPFGLMSDVHNNIHAVKRVIERHPEVKEWVCLGDIVDMFQRKENLDTVDWWMKSGIPVLRGNHDSTIAGSCDLPFNQTTFLKGLKDGARLWLPDGTEVIAFHTFPGSWDFVKKHLTEREFVDSFPLSDVTRAVAVGHNHEQFILNFPYTDAVLWSVGAIGVGRANYCIVHEDQMKMWSLLDESEPVKT